MKTKAEKIYEAIGAGYGFNGSRENAIQLIKNILDNTPPAMDPNSIETIFSGQVQIVIHKKENGPPALKEVHFSLDLPVPGPMLERDFKTASGLLTNPGVKALTNCLVQGLAGNMRAAAGKWSADDHLKYILGELHRAVNQEKVIFPEEKSYRAVLK